MSYEICKSMRKYNLKCSVVGVSIKNSKFITKTRQKHVKSTCLYQNVLENIVDVFLNNYTDGEEVRTITVFVTELKNPNEYNQLNIFEILKDDKSILDTKMEKLSDILDNLEEKYGNDKVVFGSLIK